MMALSSRNWKALAALPAVLAAIALVFFMSRPEPPLELPPIEEVSGIEVEIADTPEARAQGLSDRAIIPEGYGMLFVFETEGNYGFWMKDMFVSIDVIWLSPEGTILGIERNLAPETYPQVFYPPEPIRYVLETAVGEAERQGWEVGSSVTIR